MEAKGTITVICPVITKGNINKQIFKVTNDGATIELLLFDRLEMLQPYRVGDDVKVLYNTKLKQVGNNHYADNYVNKIEVLKHIKTTADSFDVNTKQTEQKKEMVLKLSEEQIKVDSIRKKMLTDFGEYWFLNKDLTREQVKRYLTPVEETKYYQTFGF